MADGVGAAELPTSERYELHASFGPRGSGKTKGFAGKEDIAAPFENRLDLWPEVFLVLRRDWSLEKIVRRADRSEAPLPTANEVPVH